MIAVISCSDNFFEPLLQLGILMLYRSNDIIDDIALRGVLAAGHLTANELDGRLIGQRDVQVVCLSYADSFRMPLILSGMHDYRPSRRRAASRLGSPACCTRSCAASRS